MTASYEPGTYEDLARLRLFVARISPYDVDELEARFQAVCSSWADRGTYLQSPAEIIPIAPKPAPVETVKEIRTAYVARPDPIRADPQKRKRVGVQTAHAIALRARRGAQAACAHHWSKVGKTSNGKARRYCPLCKFTETVQK